MAELRGIGQKILELVLTPEDNIDIHVNDDSGHAVASLSIVSRCTPHGVITAVMLPVEHTYMGDMHTAIAHDYAHHQVVLVNDTYSPSNMELVLNEKAPRVILMLDKLSSLLRDAQCWRESVTEPIESNGRKE